MTNNKNKKYHGILIHGGLKTKRIRSQSAERIKKSLGNSVSEGFLLLKKGKSAVDAVEASIVNMEDSGDFNAGIGSCLTIDKQIEMDASIMNGSDISAGSVGMIKNVKNPIKLARYVMEHTNHVMLVSDGAIKLAKILDIYDEKNNITQTKLKLYEKLRENIKESKYIRKSVPPSIYSHEYFQF